MLKEELRYHSIKRPDFAQAKTECKQLHDEHLARTRQRKWQQFEGNEKYDCAIDPKTGRRYNRQSR